MLSVVLQFFSVGVEFTAASSDHMMLSAHLPIYHKTLYASDAPGQFKPLPYGPLDTRLVFFQFFLSLRMLQ